MSLGKTGKNRKKEKEHTRKKRKKKKRIQERRWRVSKQPSSTAEIR
jgi:hypothetical protein